MIFVNCRAKNYDLKNNNFLIFFENVGNLFSSIEGDKDTIMGLPVKKIKEYISSL